MGNSMDCGAIKMLMDWLEENGYNKPVMPIMAPPGPAKSGPTMRWLRREARNERRRIARRGARWSHVA